METKTKRLVFGVGINDVDYVTQKFEQLGYIDGKRKQRQIWICPYYKAWRDMLARCYNPKYHESKPTYKSCSVVSEWLYLSNFKAWMEKQAWEGKQLDKDLLVPGNKIYGPDTCVFVKSYVNAFILDKTSTRCADIPIGASLHSDGKKFVARCQNPFTKQEEYLGIYSCPQEAHLAWLKRKLELANILAAEQDDARVAEALIKRYENYGKW